MNDTISKDPKAFREAAAFASTHKAPIVDYSARAIFDREWGQIIDKRVEGPSWKDECWTKLQDCRGDKADQQEVVAALTEAEFTMAIRAYLHGFLASKFIEMSEKASSYGISLKKVFQMDLDRRINPDGKICLHVDFKNQCARKCDGKDADDVVAGLLKLFGVSSK